MSISAKLGYVFIAPALILVVLFFLSPVILTGVFSFTNNTNLIKWDKQKIGETFFKSLLNIYNVEILKNKIFDFFDYQFATKFTKKKR